MADDEKPKKPKKLTDKERVFVDAYVGKCFLNATAAAREAGYSNPNANGSEIRNRPHVAAAIKRRMDERGVGQEAVLGFLADVLAGPGAYLEPLGAMRAEVNLEALVEDGKGHIIKGFKEKSAGEGERIYEVEFHDSFAAATLLARVHGLLKDRLDLTSGGQVIQPVLSGLTPDDIRRELAAARAELASEGGAFPTGDLPEPS